MSTRFQRVMDYAAPYTSDAYALDPTGHGWDRLAAIAGEYHRGEITWDQARQWCDDNARDLIALTAPVDDDEAALPLGPGFTADDAEMLGRDPGGRW